MVITLTFLKAIFAIQLHRAWLLNRIVCLKGWGEWLCLPDSEPLFFLSLLSLITLTIMHNEPFRILSLWTRGSSRSRGNEAWFPTDLWVCAYMVPLSSLQHPSSSSPSSSWTRASAAPQLRWFSLHLAAAQAARQGLCSAYPSSRAEHWPVVHSFTWLLIFSTL